MTKARLLTAALALCCAGCGGLTATYRPPAPRDLSRARRVLIVPFASGRQYYDRFFHLAASGLWPGRVVPREEAELALAGAGYDGRGAFPPRAAAVAAARTADADIVLSGYLDLRGVLRLRALGVPGDAQWFKAGRVASDADLEAFVAEIRADLGASRARLTDPPAREKRYAPSRKLRPQPRPAPGGPPVRAEGDAGPAPAVDAGAGSTQQPDEAPQGDGGSDGGSDAGSDAGAAGGSAPVQADGGAGR